MLAVRIVMIAKQAAPWLEKPIARARRQGWICKHVPVDTFERPETYDENMDYLFDKVIKGGSRESAYFRGFIDSRQSAISRYGFNFLNSKYNDEAHMQYVGLKDEILKLKNDERLFQLDKLNDEVLGQREDVMLKNIYDYSSRHEYGTALFFIGSGHRPSMLQKIERFNEHRERKLNWILLQPNFLSWDKPEILLKDGRITETTLPLLVSNLTSCSDTPVGKDSD